jgi:CDP-glycerol glycerophosphotransferase
LYTTLDIGYIYIFILCLIFSNDVVEVEFDSVDFVGIQARVGEVEVGISIYFAVVFCCSLFVGNIAARCAFNLDVVNPDVEILELGYPRNDILFFPDEERMRRTRHRLGISEDDKRKLVLYAPTWRDNQHQTGVGYTYDLNVNFDKWRRKLGENYIILFRAHYFIANSFDFSAYDDFVKDASIIDDINDLYVIADLLITDYSSVFFDYADLKRPMLFYMYDLEEYQGKMRDFYIDLNTLPGDIVTEEEELLEKISQMDYENFYDERYRKFNETYNYLDDGHAAERVVKRLIG